jgi:hypothetical protein
LDELRWAVLGAEIDAGTYAGSRVTRIYLNSFARTIREQFSDYTIHKFPIDVDTPLGLVARTSVYRLRDLGELRRFLAAEDPCILCRYQTDVDVYEPRFTRRYVTPRFYAASFRFFDGKPPRLTYEEIEEIPGTRIPTTQKLSIVAPTGAKVDLVSLAEIPWKLFGYFALDDWYRADWRKGLGYVERNRMR